jgi:flagellar biosynthesis/type III secretory pathway protein FliH
MNMVLTEWNLEEAKEVWREEGLEEGWEKGRKETEAKYQPVIVEKNRALAEKDRENQAIKREIEELRRKLRGAGID